MIAGAEPAEKEVLAKESWPRAVAELVAQGIKYSAACKAVAEQAGVSRREVYSHCLSLQKEAH